MIYSKLAAESKCERLTLKHQFKFKANVNIIHSNVQNRKQFKFSNCNITVEAKDKGYFWIIIVKFIYWGWTNMLPVKGKSKIFWPKAFVLWWRQHKHIHCVVSIHDITHIIFSHGMPLKLVAGEQSIDGDWIIRLSDYAKIWPPIWNDKKLHK